MPQNKLNNQRLIILSTICGTGVVFLNLVLGALPAYAGAQSLLDPYADISSKVESNVGFKKIAKHNVKSKEKHVAESDLNEAGKELSAESYKDKVIKAGSSKPKTANANSGFLSGMKQVQHGCITSIKAASGGIINGSKVAGTKIVAGTKSISGGIASAGSKIVPKQKTLVSQKYTTDKSKKSNQVANAKTIATNNNFPTLPGKPLDQVVEQQKQYKHIKDEPVNVAARKSGIITSAYNKYFNKNKKQSAPNMTANAANGIPTN